MGGVPGRDILTRISLPMILDKYHRPVLLPQVLEHLQINRNSRYLDATVGGGGYALEIIERGGIVIGLDMDSDAISYLKKKSVKNLFLFNNNYAEVENVLHKAGINSVAGAVFDLGISSYQLDKSNRGFSFNRDEPLDMRFNRSDGLQAVTVVNNYSQEELYEIFTKYSEEFYSRPIAKAIVRARSLKGGINSTRQLREVILAGIKNKPNSNVNSVLARIFQAIRIEVNSELKNLETALPQAVSLLGRGGRLCLVSYHSLEDRLVKLFIKKAARADELIMITKHALKPDHQEIIKNPRSRSAKLRVAEKK